MNSRLELRHLPPGGRHRGPAGSNRTLQDKPFWGTAEHPDTVTARETFRNYLNRLYFDTGIFRKHQSRQVRAHRAQAENLLFGTDFLKNPRGETIVNFVREIRRCRFPKTD